jgi:ankyrin repeat protein
MTALHYAAWRGNPAEALECIRNGAEINATDRDGYTPLHWVADRGSDPGDREPILQALLAAGADINAKDVDGRTPLAVARESESQWIIDALLARGAKE